MYLVVLSDTTYVTFSNMNRQTTDNNIILENKFIDITKKQKFFFPCFFILLLNSGL